MQETHYLVDDEKPRGGSFNGKIVYSHGKTISCGVKVRFFVSKSLEVLENKKPGWGFILILDRNNCKG